MRHQGKITHWQDDKGFGFITPKSGGKEVFVHIRSFTHRKRRPVGNEIVTFDLTSDAKGRARAERVAFLGERPPSSVSFSHSYTAVFVAIGALAFVASACFIGKLPVEALGLYFIASFIAFFAYARDKSAAKRNRWRTPESTLHLLALVGGWPGALIAQRLFRHKSNKQSFQIVFWLTVVLNCGVLGWMLSDEGDDKLRSTLGSTRTNIKWE